jgi:hypothetical protein
VNDRPNPSAFTRSNSHVGAALSRTGAKRAVAGRGRYAGDVSLPDVLHAAFVRSPFAHAKILEIDTSNARRQEGVRLRSMWTGARQHRPPQQAAVFAISRPRPPDRHCGGRRPFGVPCHNAITPEVILAALAKI